MRGAGLACPTKAALGAIAAGIVLLSGCAWFGGRKAIEPRIGATQEGVASWYGPGFHGKETAAGEVFDQYELTAAHPSLPLGTRLLVTNLANGRSVEVRVNDRGPFVDGRVLDLSYAAARTLGLLAPGTAPVRIEVLGFGPPRAARARYALQLGIYRDRDTAVRLVRRLAAGGQKAHVVPLRAGKHTYYRVRLPIEGSHEAARQRARALAREGLVPVVLLERE